MSPTQTLVRQDGQQQVGECSVPEYILTLLVNLLGMVETELPNLDLDRIQGDLAGAHQYFHSTRLRLLYMNTFYGALRRRVQLAWALKQTQPEEYAEETLPYDIVTGDAPKSEQHPLEAWDRLNYLMIVLSIKFATPQNKVGPSKWPSDTVYSRSFDAPWLENAQRLASSLENAPLSVDAPGHVRAGFTLHAYKPLQQAFGDKAMEAGIALCGEASLDVRINSLITTRDVVMERMKRVGVTATPTKWSAEGLHVEREGFEASTWENLGLLQVMDQGSQVVSHLAGASPNQLVIDFCAGAGGKTIALAGDMDNTGQLLACDVDRKRLRMCSRRAQSAAVRNLQDPIDLSWKKGAARLDSFVGKADVVFLDVPCSGSGRFRREIGRMLTWGEGVLMQYSLRQGLVLRHAGKLVAPGGVLLYCTCSFMVEENDVQVRKFLAGNPDFELEAVELNGEQHPTIQLAPYTHGTNGMFIAKLRRSRSAAVSLPDDGTWSAPWLADLAAVNAQLAQLWSDSSATDEILHSERVSRVMKRVRNFRQSVRQRAKDAQRERTRQKKQKEHESRQPRDSATGFGDGSALEKRQSSKGQRRAGDGGAKQDDGFSMSPPGFEPIHVAMSRMQEELQGSAQSPQSEPSERMPAQALPDEQENLWDEHEPTQMSQVSDGSSGPRGFGREKVARGQLPGAEVSSTVQEVNLGACIADDGMPEAMQAGAGFKSLGAKKLSEMTDWSIDRRQGFADVDGEMGGGVPKLGVKNVARMQVKNKMRGIKQAAKQRLTKAVDAQSSLRIRRPTGL